MALDGDSCSNLTASYLGNIALGPSGLGQYFSVFSSPLGLGGTIRIHYHNLWHHQMIRVDLPMPSSVESVSLLSAQKELSNTCKDWHYSDYHWDYCKDLYLWGFCKDCHCDIIGENIDRHLDTQQWHKTHWNWEEELIELKTDFQMFQRRKAINIIRSKMERRNEWGLVRKQDISSKQSSHYGCW